VNTGPNFTSASLGSLSNDAQDDSSHFRTLLDIGGHHFRCWPRKAARSSSATRSCRPSRCVRSSRRSIQRRTVLLETCSSWATSVTANRRGGERRSSAGAGWRGASGPRSSPGTRDWYGRGWWSSRPPPFGAPEPSVSRPLIREQVLKSVFDNLLMRAAAGRVPATGDGCLVGTEDGVGDLAGVRVDRRAPWAASVGDLRCATEPKAGRRVIAHQIA
jgi:hypothetical protein